MTRYGNPKRTQRDRTNDCAMFCASADRAKVEAHTAETLAAAYGVKLDVAARFLADRLGRGY